MAEAPLTDTAADTPAGVLEVARAGRRAADQAEATVLQAAVDWAAMHSVDSLPEAATMLASTWAGARDTGVPVAGPGAPLIGEFSVAEFAAALRMSTDAGRSYLGEAVELRYRLPGTWARVTSGDLVAWKARRIAKTTVTLSAEAAAFVDRHVAPVAHTIGVGQLDRLVLEGVARFMPEEAERRRLAAAESRCFEITHDQLDLSGTSTVHGVLDVADALDLDASVTAEAAALKELGSTDSLDVRRAAAVGVLARRQGVLDLTGGDHAGDAGPTRPAVERREVVLHVHLTQAALEGGPGVGRCENTRFPVTAGQIRDWCGNPEARVTVTPVIDLDEHVHVDAYEVPDRIAEAAALVDHTCVFPWCTRPARRCDRDHCRPHSADGPTCTHNIAPLCRHHHRLKTHGGWRYAVVERGSYLWTSPHGYTWLRDHTGTRESTPAATEHRRRRA